MKTIVEPIPKLEAARLDLLERHQQVEIANLAFTIGMQSGSPNPQLADELAKATQAYNQVRVLIVDLINNTQKHLQNEAQAARKKGINFPKHKAETTLLKESEQYTYQNLTDALALVHSSLIALSEVVNQHESLQEQVEENLKSALDTFLQMKKLSIASEKDADQLQDIEKKIGTQSIKREVILDDLQQLVQEWQTRIKNSLTNHSNGELNKHERDHTVLRSEETFNRVREELEKRFQDQTVELARIQEALQANVAEQARAEKEFQASVEEKVGHLQEIMFRERKPHVGTQPIEPTGHGEEQRILRLHQDHDYLGINDFVRLRQIITATIKWWWLLILAGVVAAAIGYSISQRLNPVYQATTTLLVGRSIQDAQPDSRDIDTSERLALTYASIARRQPVLQSVIDELELGYTWQTLIERVRAKPVENTQLLEIVVEASTPEEAKLIANEVARALIVLSPTDATDGELDDNQPFLEQQLDDLPTKIKEGQARIDVLERALLTASSAQQVQELQQEIYTIAGLIAAWEDNYIRMLSLTESTGGPNNLSIVEPAQALSTPVRPQIELNTLLAGAVGVLLVLAIIFTLEFLDNSIKSMDHLSQVLNLVPLGAIGQMKGKERQDRLITSQGVLSPVSEAYRMIRTNLQFMSVDRTCKAIMVASAIPEEGKSITAANLGIVFAHAGFETIIVDADLRRPTQHRIFQLHTQQGLTDLIRLPELDVAQHLITTEVAQLRVLTSGSLPPNPSEILGSQQMERLLTELKEIADVVILDSPPAVAYTDAAVLSNRVDGVVLVVKAGRHQRDVVKAIRTLQQTGSNFLGAILNGISNKQVPSYYGRYHSAYNADEPGRLTVYARLANKLRWLPFFKSHAFLEKSGSNLQNPHLKQVTK